MKIHILSNSAHAPTGYGNQVQVNVPRLRALGHELSMTAFYGLQGAPSLWDGMLVLPASHNPYGNDVIVADAMHVQADIVITLMDVWVLATEVMQQVAWYPWLPVDHDPAPPAVLDALRAARRPICYAQFGVRMLKDAGLDPLYVPHSVDRSVYHPLDRAEARKTLGFKADEYVVGLVAANKGAPSRKAFDQQIRAFAEFQRRHADAVLYLHTDMLGMQGENLRRIIELAEIPKTAIVEVPSYRYARGFIPWSWMAQAYNAFDVLLHATRGEGFGLTIIEAQACGCPAIVTDFSSMPELVTDGLGWKVGVSDKFFSQDSYQVTPSVPEIVDALEQAYARRGDADLRAAVAKTMDAYDADHVAEAHWKPVLAEIEQEIRGVRERAQTARLNRKEQRRLLHDQRAKV